MIVRRSVRCAVLSVAVSLTMLLVAGCAGKVQPEFVDVTVDVSLMPGISADMLRAFLYDTENGELLGQFFIDSKTEGPDGTVCFCSSEKLRRGVYDVVIYNFDVPDTFIRGEGNINTLEAYTAEVNDGIRNRFGDSLKEFGNVTYAPDRLGVARIMNADVREGASLSGELVSVVSDADLKLQAEGLEWSTSRSVVARGFAASWFLGTGLPGEVGSIWFEMQVEAASNLVACVPTFGVSDDSIEFVFNVTTSGGSYLYSTTTDRSFSFEQGIVIPEPEKRTGGDDGSGFSPQIGEWKNVSVDVPIS